MTGDVRHLRVAIESFFRSSQKGLFVVDPRHVLDIEAVSALNITKKWPNVVSILLSPCCIFSLSTERVKMRVMGGVECQAGGIEE